MSKARAKIICNCLVTEGARKTEKGTADKYTVGQRCHSTINNEATHYVTYDGGKKSIRPDCMIKMDRDLRLRGKGNE